MIFDEQRYSPKWVSEFPLIPVPSTETGIFYPRLTTQNTIGGLAPRSGHWHFEPGLGADLEISEILLLCSGFRLTMLNEQVCELLHSEPGIFMGRLPGRANPELFSTQQKTEMEGPFSFVTDHDQTIGLWTKTENDIQTFALVQLQGNRQDCQSKLEAIIPNIPGTLPKLWEQETSLRQKWCSEIPSETNSERMGLAFERLQGLIERRVGIFEGTWVRDDSLEYPGMSLDLTFQILPAVAQFESKIAAELLQTVSSLPRLENGAWAASYSIKGEFNSTQPALPFLATVLKDLPGEALKQLKETTFLDQYSQHLQCFLASSEKEELPHWPSPETSFTPEITDPSSLKQFDLSALLVVEMENLQRLSGNKITFEAQRKELESIIWKNFWCSKRKRLLDKTMENDFAARLTAGSLLPLLWKSCPKSEFSFLNQSLSNREEFRASEGIRQWEPKKEDPVPPPVVPRTQLLFLPLLHKLSTAAASILSADWHRLLEADSDLSNPASASLLIQLTPFSRQINPQLEKYPAWVRTMEKHRKSIVTIAAVILLLVPAGFSIFFSIRKDFSQQEELLQSGHAETLLTMGNLEEAEKVYTRLITRSRMKSRLENYYLSRANLRFKLNRYEEALSDYQKTIELDPIGNLFKARWNLAQVYARLNRYEEAIDVLEAFNNEYGEELPGYKQNAEHAMHLWKK